MVKLIRKNFSRDMRHVTPNGPLDGLVDIGVESLVQGDSDKGRWPDGSGGIYKESTGQSSETVSDKVGTNSVQDLVAKAVGVRLVKEDGERLHGDNIVGVGSAKRDTGHDRDEHVLLFGKIARVETVLIAEGRPLLCWENSGHEFSNGIGDQLGNVGSDNNGRVSDVEKCVDERARTSKNDSHGPDSESERGHIHVIGRVDICTDFGVRRVLGREDRLKLHLADQVPMLVWGSEDRRIV